MTPGACRPPCRAVSQQRRALSDAITDRGLRGRIVPSGWRLGGGRGRTPSYSSGRGEVARASLRDACGRTGSPTKGPEEMTETSLAEPATSLDELGPVDYAVVEFPAGKSNFTGEMAAE